VEFEQAKMKANHMKLILSIFTFLSLSFFSHSQTTIRWHIIKSNGEQGFIDSTGKEIFTGKFRLLSDTYYDGLAFYSLDSKSGFIDENGNVVFILPDQAVASNFSEGLCNVNEPNQFYYINTKGEIAIDLKELELPEGKELSQCFSFHDGLAAVRIQNIGHKGDSLFEDDFRDLRNFYIGDWYYGFINKSGDWVIEPNIDDIMPFKDGIAIVKKSSTIYFMDTAGKILLSLDSTNLEYYSEGFANISCDSGQYYINKYGKRLNNQVYNRSKPFSEGMAAVEIDDSWGYINSKGEIVIEPKYYFVNNFSEGLASVSIIKYEKGYFLGTYFTEGFIDKKGNTIIPFEENVDYDSSGFRNGIVKGRRFIHDKNNKYTGYYELFYINRKGVKIWSEILKQ
jgi:hypothetical protein